MDYRDFTVDKLKEKTVKKENILEPHENVKVDYVGLIPGNGGYGSNNRFENKTWKRPGGGTTRAIVAIKVNELNFLGEQKLQKQKRWKAKKLENED